MYLQSWLQVQAPRLHLPRIRHNPQNVDATTQSRKGAPKQTDSIIWVCKKLWLTSISDFK